MKKTEYRVTDVAGPRPSVAGRRVRPGDTLKLSESEARFELSRGTIVAATEAPAAEKTSAKKGG